MRRLENAQRRETHHCATNKIARSLNSKVEKKSDDIHKVSVPSGYLKPRVMCGPKPPFKQAAQANK